MPSRLVIPEDQLQSKLLEACNLLMKIRTYRKRFEADHGAADKNLAKLWEARADEFLASLVTEPDYETKDQKS
jgi:hypothetical protein